MEEEDDAGVEVYTCGTVLDGSEGKVKYTDTIVMPGEGQDVVLERKEKKSEIGTASLSSQVFISVFFYFGPNYAQWQKERGDETAFNRLLLVWLEIQ